MKKRQKKKKNYIARFFIFLIFSAILLYVYVTHIERNLLITKELNYTFSNGDNSLRVVQFTDTHLGEFYSIDMFSKAVDEINDADADIVLFTGDLFDVASKYDQKEEAVQLLSEIEANIGKYAVFGNHDYGGGAARIYEDLMEEAGFEVLVDEHIALEKDGEVINLVGVDDYLLGTPDNDIAFNLDEKALNIMLIHEPDAISNYKDENIDIAFAGHSHGGQVALPFYGPIITAPLGDIYVKGEYEPFDDTLLYVSSGLGSTTYPYRLFNVPEIIVVDMMI